MAPINYAQGTKSWSGLAYSDQQQVVKDPTHFLPVKSLQMTPDKKWNKADVMTGSTSEPDGFRRPGALSAKGKVDSEFFPEGIVPMLIAGMFGAPVSTQVGRMVIKVLITSDSGAATITLQVNSETEITLDTTGSIANDTSTLLGLVNSARPTVVSAAYVDANNHALGINITGHVPFVLTLGSTEGEEADQSLVNLSSAHTHVFKHGDIVPVYGPNLLAEGFSIVEVMDKDNGDQFNYCGVYVDGLSLDFSKDEPLKVSVSLTGNEGNHGIGKSATSISNGSLSFPIVISGGDKLTIAANGGTAVDVLLTAGSYTVIQLVAMINGLLVDTAALLNDVIDKRPLLACAWDLDNGNFIFYTDKKGSGTSLHITNGPSTMAMTTPIETAGSDTPSSPTFPLAANTTHRLQPFIGTGATVKINSLRIPAEKLKIDFKNNFKKDNYLGVNFPIQNVINGRFEITGTIDIKVTAANRAYWDDFLNDTAAALEIDIETGIAIDPGYNYSGKILLPLIKLTKNNKPKAALPGVVTQTLAFQAYLDTDTSKDCEIDITNSQATI